ncbi:uncharacterized protein TNCV_2015881 [Trichonephila clavipes]|nr:uncharacterized protein TNCV_2015881 [Trichonephila clavipes]
MTENEKFCHLMKGVAEDVCQSLLVKDISCTSDFIKECQRFEEMNYRLIDNHRFTRLPNIVLVASIRVHEDLVTLIRHIVRERPRTYATVVHQPRGPIEPLPVPRGRPMCGKPTITDLFAFIVGDQATWLVTAVNDELFSMHTEAAKQPAVSYHPLTCPLTNAAGKRLEHHHLFQAGECYRSPSPYDQRSPS